MTASMGSSYENLSALLECRFFKERYSFFILPAYSGLSAHGHQSTRSKYRIGVGLLALEIIDGKLVHCHPYYRIVDLRTREEL